MHSALPARPQPMVRSLGHISKKERNVTSTNNHLPVSFNEKMKMKMKKVAMKKVNAYLKMYLFIDKYSDDNKIQLNVRYPSTCLP